MTRQIVAANLARLMELHPDLQSQSALSRRAKIAHSHVGRILRQESSATVDMLDAIAEAFGVQTWELLTDTESTRKRALEKMMFGNHVPDSRAEESLPPPPAKVVAMRRRKKQ